MKLAVKIGTFIDSMKLWIYPYPQLMKLVSWSVGETLILNLLPQVLSHLKWNLLHMIPIGCRYAWPTLGDAWPNGSRVMPPFRNSYISIYPYFLDKSV